MESNTEVIPEWSLPDRLRKAMEHARLSDETMAAELGVTDRTVRNYLSGHTTPKAGFVRLWARITSVPIEWLAPELCAPRDSNPESAEQVLVAA